MTRFVCAAFTLLLATTVVAGAQAQPSRATDQDISDAYIYLLGRLLVTRQQQLDFQEGFKWNELVHRKPGAVGWPPCRSCCPCQSNRSIPITTCGELAALCSRIIGSRQSAWSSSCLSTVPRVARAF